ncbi:long-chain-fatty-acid--CoA ligase [Kribbella kalugense]|uniref:Fatty-acyl-CoA synthase n=1 Tax=Kribbella kalugense TaxID=2512221 RepID=A0A4R8A1C7_9ACTN|nr:long-chain-fatty-acid--CoA ligase [Kribbella kalugense]TDW21920.1 fatty-acyl-CoA synthase [Kribbella kalugense]
MFAHSFTALTPLSFLQRSADVFADKTAIAYGDRRISYSEFGVEATRLADALRSSGIQPGDRVAYLLPNIPEMLIANFGVPLAGAVLVAVNTRLSPEEVRYVCDHSGAKILVVDTEYLPALSPAVESFRTVSEVIAVSDLHGPAAHEAVDPAYVLYDEFLKRGTGEPVRWTVEDENSMISINYSSGTTGQPKGAMYTHRGAYLNALGEIIHQRFDPESVYLWTLPMFHCNGWCTPWAVTGIGATHVCLRAVRANVIWHLIDEERVTHLDGAPTVLTTIAEAPEAHALERELVATVAGAAPSPTVIARMRELGARIVHVYGMTELYGPYTLNEWQAGWAALPPADQARRQARQGVAMIQADPIRVVDQNMVDVPRDGRTMGEIVMRGNNVMAGYFDDTDATEKAFRGGWLHSGDLGVQHSDGYVELRDRAKDIVISGGENISTVEIEHALEAHDSVLEVAVIGIPDDKWGERPKAFVVRQPGSTVDEAELIAHLRAHIAKYKVPKAVEFVEQLPRTSTGKIQKFELREKEWVGHVSRIQG